MKSGRWLDVVIIIAILGTAVRLSGIAPLDSWLHPRDPMLQPGQKVSFAGVDWRHDRTLVVFADAACAVCQQSVELYRSLGESTKTAPNALRLLVLAPSERLEQARQWLAAKQVHADVIELDEPSWRGFVITPTTFIVNRAGIISDIAIGRLTTTEADQLSERFKLGTGPAVDKTPREVSRAVCDGIRDPDGQLLDIRTREAFTADDNRRGRNIPFNELALRARAELVQSRRLVILEAPDADIRGGAGAQLRADGFRDVLLCVS
jgi:hypothetical protein